MVRTSLPESDTTCLHPEIEEAMIKWLKTGLKAGFLGTDSKTELHCFTNMDGPRNKKDRVLIKVKKMWNMLTRKMNVKNRKISNSQVKILPCHCRQLKIIVTRKLQNVKISFELVYRETKLISQRAVLHFQLF